MRRAAALVVVAGLSALAFIPPTPQAPIKSLVDDPLCVLIARPENYFTYVQPPEQRRTPTGEVATSTATFQVTYNGFTPQAQASFQAAVDIWSNLVVSATPIRVTANWTALAPNVLGSAGAHFINGNFSGAPLTSTWYGDALADALHGSDLNAGTADIDASFNSNFANWYLGTDGATPGGQYDLESVVLHELGHGLNFFGLANVTGGSGSIGQSGFPSIYDRFTATETGAFLLATFTNPSIALGTQLTQNFNGGNPRGPGVYFNGTNTNAANGAQTARLYTVSPWAPGSSYSHLDESTYPAGNQNSLMTYALGQAEAIHNPGPVTLGLFKDEGWQIATPCSPSLNPTSATIAKAGGGGTVNVTIGGGCGWTAVANNGFIHVTAPGTGTGNGSFAYTVDANGTTPRSGTITVGTATFTVNQVGNTVTMSPGTLYFKGTNTAGVLNPMTGAQNVTVSFIGTGGTTWSVASNQAWAKPTGGIGTNSGQFSVAIVNPGNILNGQTHVTASLTLTATNVGNSPQIATVDLVLVAPGATTVPYGQVDAPLQGATNIQGAIGVSGWVLDDVGVTSVKIYRNCLYPAEPPTNCVGGIVPGDPGLPLVPIGDAAFVAGVRPDLEAAFPTTPQNYRAGWGLLVLTNMLPRTSGGPFAQYGGQGPLTLYAVATDIEGNKTLLGRVWTTDHDPTNITMANDTIAKPFGALDTPTQGGNASTAAFGVFGWVLTPDLNTVADGTDILMPTNGSTMFVYVDGAPVANVTYNQCRGSVGNPPPGGVYCDDDVASIFGNATPQLPLTPRASNPTRYRNLDAGRGPQGSYALNTTLLSNGLHSIAWSATDSNGRVEGIGSRNFIVLNGGARPIGPDEEDELLKAPAQPRALASTLETFRVSNRPVSVRTGYDLRTPMKEIARDRNSVRTVTIGMLGRLELGFAGPVQGGYLVANGTLRDLPVGSSLDTRTGVFAWTPPLGYLGTYHLAFLVNGERVVVDVTVVVDDPDAAVRQDKRTIK